MQVSTYSISEQHLDRAYSSFQHSLAECVLQFTEYPRTYYTPMGVGRLVQQRPLNVDIRWPLPCIPVVFGIRVAVIDDSQGHCSRHKMEQTGIGRQLDHPVVPKFI